MIIVGEIAVDPIYIRITQHPAFHHAVIAVSVREFPSGAPAIDTVIDAGARGRFIVTAVKRHDMFLMIEAFDPLAAIAKWRVCKELFDNSNTPPAWVLNDVSTTVIFKLICDQIPPLDLQAMKVELRAATAASTTKVPVVVRYDTLFPAYERICAADPTIRLNIAPPDTTGNVVVQPTVGASAAAVISADYIVDYSLTTAVPTTAVVLGQGTGQPRDARKHVVGSGLRQMFVSALFSTDILLDQTGQTALAAAAVGAVNTTLKLAADDVPTGLAPADVLRIENTDMRVQSVEYTSSTRGEVAYITVGGQDVTLADRIDALIELDYAARV